MIKALGIDSKAEKYWDMERIFRQPEAITILKEDGELSEREKIIKSFYNAKCIHPMEYDSQMYDDTLLEKLEKNHIETKNLKEHKSEMDFYANFKKNKGFEKNEFAFYNPVCFLAKLDKAGVFEFNPYEGKTYREIFAENKTVKKLYSENRIEITQPYAKITVVSNPGFAPLFDVTIKDNRPNVNGYGCITGFFNADYLSEHGKYKYYYHEGVDFRGSRGTEVVSLIYGKIIRFGPSLKMQGVVLMQANGDPNLYYLAAHLDESSFTEFKLCEGKKISPGDKIARIGIYSGGDHLHVSVIKLNEKDKIESQTGAIYWDSKEKIWKFPTWGYPEKMKNPFNYNSDYWAGRK